MVTGGNQRGSAIRRGHDRRLSPSRARDLTVLLEDGNGGGWLPRAWSE